MKTLYVEYSKDGNIFNQDFQVPNILKPTIEEVYKNQLSEQPDNEKIVFWTDSPIMVKMVAQFKDWELDRLWQFESWEQENA